MGRARKANPARGAALLVVACAFVVALPLSAWPTGSVSTFSPRQMAMGGAFLAVEDEVSCGAWNPAGLRPAACRRGSNLRLHVNVLGAPAIARETGLITGRETEQFERLSPFEKACVVVGGVVKGVSFRRGGFAAGLVLLEEELDPLLLGESRGLADARDLLDAYYSSVAVAFHVAPRVSIGVSGTVFAGRDGSGGREVAVGRAYGALLRPNDAVAVGLTYFDAPGDFAEYRRVLEGFAPGTMNAGISYHPTPGLLFALDVRDLAESHDDTALSPRAGFEWNVSGRGALRLGAFREGGGGPRVVTVGVGAIPMMSCWEGPDALRGDAFVLNYAALVAEERGPRHLLSVVLHF